MAIPLFIVVFLIIVWQLWRSRSNTGLKEMNAGVQLVQEKRYAEAELHFRQLLTKRLPPGVEADTRRRLALALDVLERSEEAAEQRHQASAIAMTAPKDYLALMAQGDLLNSQHRHEEACEMYRRALRFLLGTRSRRQRAQVMEKLATAHHQAGHSPDALKWAEASLASDPSASVQRRMRVMAGMACSNQGDLESAEAHFFRVLEASETDAVPEEAIRALAMLADIQRKRGHLAEALAAAKRAAEKYDGPSRAGALVEVECLRDMGRFDEARAVAVRIAQGPQHALPSVARQMKAVCTLTLACVEAAADRPEAALAALRDTREHLKAVNQSSVWPPPPASRESKNGLHCDALQMRVHAQLGQQEAAWRLWESVENRLSRYADDRTVLMNVYGQFARAAFYLGALAESRASWQHYLDCKPHPLGLLSAHYWLGETHLCLGETDAARDCFRQAAAPGIDSLDARRAAARLNELGG